MCVFSCGCTYLFSFFPQHLFWLRIFLWFLVVFCFGNAYDFVFVFVAVCFFLLYALTCIFFIIIDRFFIALFSVFEQTHCARV